MNALPYTQNIVIDLEFTPAGAEGRAAGLRNEVIEVGAVRVLPDGRVQDEFRCAVRPQFASTIASHVRKLTGLSWADVVGGCSFEEALARLEAWIGEGRTRMVAWSGNDQAQILDEARAKGVAVPANMTRWLDLQRVFPRMLQVGKRGGRMALHVAVEWYGCELESCSEHAALLDAEHTADLLNLLLTGDYREHRSALERAAAPAPEASHPDSRFAALGALLAAMGTAAVVA